MPRSPKTKKIAAPKSTAAKQPKKKPIEQYDHKGAQRVNNPPVGLVTPYTDKETAKKTYAYDPHLDPQLVWAGKAEHTSFEVPTLSLHVHERIDPLTIIEAVRKRNGGGVQYQQLSFFDTMRENPPLREAIEFYKHRHDWSNRLIAGDSLLVMNSLLEKEGLAGQVQMFYIDPPYGIKYGSNFQPFVNKRDVKDGKDEDLTAEPEQIRAFRDAWELGIHSYLTYLRDRLLLARELLSEPGSIFVQIGDDNVHRVRVLMDEVFGKENYIALISFVTQNTTPQIGVPIDCDYLLWYAKDKRQLKFRRLFKEILLGPSALRTFNYIELPSGASRPVSNEEKEGLVPLPVGARPFDLQDNLRSWGTDPILSQPYILDGHPYSPGNNRKWTALETLDLLKASSRLYPSGITLMARRYLDDFPMLNISSIWTDTTGGFIGSPKVYSTQTNTKVVSRCLLMTTDPGDLVFDPTCGSGTTAYVAEQWGRRWITCDTSRVAITLAKQRLMTALFEYYELAHPDEGVDSGLRYKTVPHITLKSIAKNEQPAQETLYDQPFVDNSRARVTGPFTVEAVPAPVVKPVFEVRTEMPADESIARSGETLRQAEWRDELLRTGIRGKGGQKIEFTRVEPLSGTRWLHADAETREARPQRVVVSFGSEFAPLEQRQVGLAIEEAQTLVPRPRLIVFAAFQFDPEAARDIDETHWPGATLLKAQMNTDLLTEDLKKKRASNESFWLIGQPDVVLEKIKTGEHKGKYRLEVHGFDYYNTRTGSIESGGTEKIAMWLLDTDYDGRSLFPRQVFFPLAGEKEGWARLARSLQAEIDEELIEAYRGTVSLPFEVGKHRRVAVKIVDDRGIESLKVIEVE